MYISSSQSSYEIISFVTFLNRVINRMKKKYEVSKGLYIIVSPMV